MLSFFPRGVLDESLNLIESVSEGFPSYSFRRKNLVIEMVNVGSRVDRRTGVNNLFPEHNSTTVRNILTILGRIIEQVNTECRVQE